MIYVSSSCVNHTKIKDSIKELVNHGFKNIELSGGTKYYDGFIDDLLELKDKYNLNYLCHNYFPPPQKDFVLNLASLNDDIYYTTIEHLTKSIDLSTKLEAKKFGFHAGFFIDINVVEIGKHISKNTIYNKEKALKRFCDGYKYLSLQSKNLELYIENNVYSITNYNTYNGNNIFMLTSQKEFNELKNYINFKLLLDIAHLKVSCNSLKNNFELELKTLLSLSDYIHISDNDSLHDLNNTLKTDSNIISLLKNENLDNKDFTLEIYDNITSIKKSYDSLKELII
jgi:sugar phosphate isomerase/epimerase